MMEQQVRAYWIRGALDFLKVHHSAESERLLENLPGEIRQAMVESHPAEWCPRSYHVELMNAIVAAEDNPLGAYDALLAYGQHVASDVLGGSLRPLMQIVDVKLFARKLPDMWARDHQDESRLESDISQVEDARVPLRFLGLRGYNHSGIAMLGWIKSGITQLTRRAVHVKQAGWSLSQPAPNELTCEVSWS